MESHRELVQLARLALSGRDDDVQMYIRRIARKLKSIDAESADQLFRLLAESPTRHSPLRGEMAAIPVDPDSRLQLLRCYDPVVLDVEDFPVCRAGFPFFGLRPAGSLLSIIRCRPGRVKGSKRGAFCGTLLDFRLGKKMIKK